MLLDAGFIKGLKGSHLLLQPHLDDIPFSMGDTLLEGVLGDKNYEVWTLFGKEYFNIREYPHDESTIEILHKEENLWFERIGTEIHRLEMEEAGYRGIANPRKLFLAQAALKPNFDYGSMDYGNWEPVLANFRMLVEKGFQYIWAPAGVGGHCDHLAVRQAVLEIVPACKEVQGVLFYDELPYKMYSKPIIWENFDIPGFHIAGKADNMLGEEKINRKYESLLIFHSQINQRQAAVLSAWNESMTIWLRGRQGG